MDQISVENISYTYQGKYQKVQALKNVSCTFEKQKFYAVIGHSGSGKTTLLSMLAGLGVPTEGSMLVDGTSLQHIGTERHRRENVSVIYQAFNLFPALTVLENVMYPMQIGHTSKKEAALKAKKLLNSVKITDNQFKKFPTMLSGGEQQRVAIARALATNPSILLCDEATSALDSMTTESILNLLQKINRETKVTIIIITHEMSVVEKICNKVVVLDKAEIAAQGLTREVFDDTETDIVQRLIGGSQA